MNSERPYRQSHTKWLTEHAEIFQSVLEAASRHKADLERLYTASKSAPVDLIEFCELDESDLATAHKVCDRIMENLTPTLKEMNKEIDARRDTPGDSRLPLLS